MSNQKPTEEELRIIRQISIEDMIRQYVPSIVILQENNMPDETIEERIKKALLKDLNLSPFGKEFLRKNTYDGVFGEREVDVDVLHIYLQVREDYLLLLKAGGLYAFLRALDVIELET